MMYQNRKMYINDLEIEQHRTIMITVRSRDYVQKNSRRKGLLHAPSLAAIGTFHYCLLCVVLMLLPALHQTHHRSYSMVVFSFTIIPSQRTSPFLVLPRTSPSSQSSHSHNSISNRSIITRIQSSRSRDVFTSEQLKQHQRQNKNKNQRHRMVMAAPDAIETNNSSFLNDVDTSQKERTRKQSAKTTPVQKSSSSLSKSPSSSSSSSSSKATMKRKSTSTSTMSMATSATASPTTITAATKSSKNTKQRKRRRKKYQRKRPKTNSEMERDRIKKKRQKQYEQLLSKGTSTNLWAFESLFPDPEWDEESIYRDLYEVAERDASISGSSINNSNVNGSRGKKELEKLDGSATTTVPNAKKNEFSTPIVDSIISKVSRELTGDPMLTKEKSSGSTLNNTITSTTSAPITNNLNANSTKVDRSLTRMVEDRLYGFRRGQMGEFEYDTSLMGDGAVKFRDGIRLGNALKVNSDRLTYFAKREMIHGKLEEAEELYEKAISISPADGRAYLGLAKIAERRRDFKSARDCLRAGIAKSRLEDAKGLNPYLLQALGNLEERMGHLSEAEKLYIDAAKSRPAHAAAWVSLAQLRTRKLRQGPNAGRICYQSAERELKKAGLPKSSYVYTAWGALESKAGDIRKSRKLFKKAIEVDPKCSAAWLQLGVMEANQENWDEAQECFETVLKFDKRNSRVLQAYALMETKRPDGDSREAIGLFERALKANPRDGGVFQAYALYVAKLGDIESARGLLRRGTEIDKRHAPLWQAWGVLETRHGTASDAREVFQQGIWACAQSSGGQSGGRRCARLWQAWGVLEAQERDYAAARRCFSRALDADNWNVAAITAWTLMEQELGQYKDAKLIFERSLRQFSSSSNEKIALWRAYELMEAEAGNLKAAQNVYQRSVRDSMGSIKQESISDEVKNKNDDSIDSRQPTEDILKKSSEVEVSRWNRREGFGESDVWMKDGSIESKVPSSAMNKGQKFNDK